MAKTYTTVQGDMWDSIAYTQMGDTAHTDKLMRANARYLGFYVFPAGIELTIPEADTPGGGDAPPWKRAAG